MTTVQAGGGPGVPPARALRADRRARRAAVSGDRPSRLSGRSDGPRRPAQARPPERRRARRRLLRLHRAVAQPDARLDRRGPARAGHRLRPRDRGHHRRSAGAREHGASARADHADPRHPAQRGSARHPRLRRRGRPHRRHEPCGPAAAVHPRGRRARPAGAGGLAADRGPRGALLGSDGADHARRHAGRGRRGALLARAGRPGGRPHPRVGLRPHRGLGARDGAPDELRHRPRGGSPRAALRGGHRAHPDGRDERDRAGGTAPTSSGSWRGTSTR